MFLRSGSPFAESLYGWGLQAAHRSLLALAFLGGLLAGCGGGDSADEPAPENDEVETQTPEDAGDVDAAMSRKLKDKDVQNYMATFQDLKELGAVTDQKLGDDPSTFAQMATAFTLPGKWEAVLKKHGFDGDTYTEVHIAVIGALGALLSEDAKAQFAEQKKKQAEQIEKMKKVLSPEQLAELEQGMAAAEQQVMSAYESVPKANVELARKYRAQLEAMFK